jgi:nudix-type nucleoside diphosphatase (YffH/AdpP family)
LPIEWGGRAVSQFRKVEVRKQSRIFNDFFKIDELVVAYQKRDGSMSADQRRLVFERGDAAAVLLFNTDRNCVVLVEQFKAPTLGKGLGGGWITETVAGIVEPNETPESAAVRETSEETGYQISIAALQPIAKFFSSPGGASECIYLYYAEVRDADKVGKGGGNEAEGEDIEVKEMPLDELLEMVKCNRIEDPKLLIGALWLGDELKAKRGDDVQRAPEIPINDGDR